MAPLSFFGGLYANGRDALPRREYRTRCRRSSDGRTQAGMSNGHDRRKVPDLNGHHLSPGKTRRFGGRRARRPRVGERLARAAWRAAMAHATSDRISEILPHGGPRLAVG